LSPTAFGVPNSTSDFKGSIDGVVTPFAWYERCNGLGRMLKMERSSMNAMTTSLRARAQRAHALKNCLAVVHAVNKLVEPELSEKSRERLERSQNALKRMLTLLDEDLTAGGTTDPTNRAFVQGRGSRSDHNQFNWL
jgi:hypothetical protein